MAARIPNTFIVGAPKSGTTSLYELLRQHPDVFMSATKEPYYFGDDLTYRMPRIGEADYRALFADARDEAAVGEASVTYLYSSSAAEEIHAFNPEARIIIMLREPVSMMHSLHSQLLFTRVEDLHEFSAALAAEPDRSRGLRIPADATIVEFLRYRGFADYAPQVRRYLDVFERSAVHIIIFDEFVRDPAAAYREVLRFLQVDEDFRPLSFEPVNRNKVLINEWLGVLLNHARFLRVARKVFPFPKLRRRLGAAIASQFLMKERPRSSIDATLRSELKSEFGPKIVELERVLGVELPRRWVR